MEHLMRSILLTFKESKGVVFIMTMICHVQQMIATKYRF